MDYRYSPFKVVDEAGKTLGTFPNIVFAQLFLAGLLEHDFKGCSIKALRNDVSPFDKLTRFFGLDEVTGELFEVDNE